MTDVLTKEQRSYCMSRIRSKDTKVELSFRKYIWSLGLRNYRVKTKLYGKPDIVFPKEKIAVFIDGCFWHKCSKCYIEPKSNKEFWLPKIERNIQRDKDVTIKLESEGWKVVRFWEHEIRDNKEKYAEKLLNLLKG